MLSWILNLIDHWAIRMRKDAAEDFARHLQRYGGQMTTPEVAECIGLFLYYGLFLLYYDWRRSQNIPLIERDWESIHTPDRKFCRPTDIGHNWRSEGF